MIYILHPQTQMTDNSVATLCQPLLCRQVTYRALEQLSESGFDLVKVEAAVKRTRHSQNLDSLLVAASPRPPSSCPIDTVTRDLASKGESDTASRRKSPINKSFADAKMKRVAIVSPKEIAKDQGKPLSKYERNMMIFDWLHTLGNTFHIWKYFHLNVNNSAQTSPRRPRKVRRPLRTRRRRRAALSRRQHKLFLEFCVCSDCNVYCVGISCFLSHLLVTNCVITRYTTFC